MEDGDDSGAAFNFDALMKEKTGRDSMRPSDAVRPGDLSDISHTNDSVNGDEADLGPTANPTSTTTNNTAH